MEISQNHRYAFRRRWNHACCNTQNANNRVETSDRKNLPIAESVSARDTFHNLLEFVYFQSITGHQGIRRADGDHGRLKTLNGTLEEMPRATALCNRQTTCMYAALQCPVRATAEYYINSTIELPFRHYVQYDQSHFVELSRSRPRCMFSLRKVIIWS